MELTQSNAVDSSLISPVFLKQLLPPFELSAQIKKLFSGEKVPVIPMGLGPSEMPLA